MTASLAARPRGTVRFSVLAKCALLIALATASVVTVLSLQSASLMLRTVSEGVIRTAAVSTEALADATGGSLRFGKGDILVADIGATLARSGGLATAGLASAVDGTVVARLGEPDDDLAGLAAEAIRTGEPAVAGDGFLVAYPSRFGSDRAVVGAVAVAWSAEPVLGAIAAEKRRIALVGLALLAAALVGATLAVRQWIAVPLRRVGSAMKAVVAGAHDTAVPCRDRTDEIGLVARDLEYFRDMMADAAGATQAAIFDSAGFQNASAAMVLTDRDFRIAQFNRAFAKLARANVDAFRTKKTDFDPDHLIGTSIDMVKAGAGRDGDSVIDHTNLPMTTDIRIGPRIMALGINAILGAAGNHVGYVVEWADVTCIRRDAAVLAALEARQIMLEFDAGFRLLGGNAIAAAALGVPSGSLPGQSLDEMIRPRGVACDTLRATLSGGEASTGRFEISLGEGATILVDGIFFPVLDARQKAAGHLLLGHDITEQERRLGEAEAARKRMEAGQKQVVEALRTGLARLSEGDLTHAIDEVFAEDHEQLRLDFNRTISDMHDVIVEVRELAQTMTREVGEITGAADDLSRRTEHQAATLEETAAALAEITAAVTSAADGARRANEVVGEARSNAESSGDVVREAVSAMSEIATSSKQISKIIGVIDDIAFQTNLLALNAGVEAARAGDAGRGFAVVASEVRALAQRSSEAAREISDLITTSGRHVGRGVDLVGQAGEALTRISGSVEGISTHVAEISVSAQEQSAGLTEINTSMGQLDQVTQQNAAMFEETTAAAHALARQAETLAQRMARFRVRAEPMPAAGASAGRAPGLASTASRARHAEIPARIAAPPLHPAHRRGAAAAATAVADDDDWQDF